MSEDEIEERLLAPLRRLRRDAALFFDLDGTLLEIVERAEDVSLPPRAAELLGELRRAYRQVAILTGRAPLDARRIVGDPELLYVGNHGYELLEPGAETPVPSPVLDHETAVAAARYVATLDRERLAAGELRLEDKGPIQALHWRGAAAEAAAARAAAALGAEAERAGLRLHHGRKVLELRPPVAMDKGVAIAEQLRGSPARAAFYAGDDRTDVDAFGALAELHEAGELEHVVRIAVRSEEAPDELERAADAAVDGTAGMLGLMERLG